MNDIRAIAFYLPQYHPIPENDAWWGKGFTEWTNVAKARPLFRGHDQPHLPADLGFYDLRVPEARQAQAELAREHGLDGFCYYHYWFNGRRLLERPFAEVLASGTPDIPFCLCWANETWSRRWIGEERDVLIAQEHSPEDDRRHAAWLLRALDDPRQIRVGDRPVFLVYRPNHLPDARATAEIFREVVTGAGLPEPWLVGVDGHCPGTDCRTLGFDATLEFAPQLGVYYPDMVDDRPSPGRLLRNLKRGVPDARLKLYDDADARRRMRALGAARAFPAYPCCYVAWDNSPRRGADGIILVDGSPAAFEAALRDAVARAGGRPPGDRLVFINAWNEWAEGNHLEPDQRQGRSYLEAVRRVVAGSPREAEVGRIRVP
jgi:hypothetical protein